MMDWLFKEDNYIPIKDKSTYIDKSILSILGTLSKIRQDDNKMGKGYYRLSPYLKFIFTFLIIIFLVLTRSFYYVLLIDSYLLLLISSLFLKDIKKILSITFVVLCFSAIVLLPSAYFGNGKNSLMICLKITGTVMSLNILSYTTKARHITKSLKFFFVPDIFILIMDMTIKYIVILGNFSINMLYALKIRSVGRDKSKHTSLSGLIGTLFLKSKEMAEETFYAMESRGFTGDYKSRMEIKFHVFDFIYLLINIFLLSMFFLIGKG